MSQRFFQQINYSASNEDSQSELTALEIKSTDQVVCITGSGARTLDLLIASPKRIYSVDFNPPQNHLLNFKITGFQNLNHLEFTELMGLKASSRRAELFLKVAKHLPPESQVYWSKKKRLAAKGLLYCGTWEKLLRWISKASILRRRHVNGLWDAPDLNSQIEYWEKHWTGKFLPRLLRILSSRFLWTKVIREPGAKLIPREFDVGAYMYGCLSKMAHHSLIRENPFANLIFRGHYTQHCFDQLPHHLLEVNFEKIKTLTNRIEPVTAPLADFLDQHPSEMDAYSLSDFASYAPAPIYNQIWNSVVKAAKPGAKFCERFFLVKPEAVEKPTTSINPQDHWSPRSKRNSKLESSLELTDHTCLYSFRAGEIS